MRKEDTRMIKGLAIIMMVWLHLFSNLDYISVKCIHFLYYGKYPLAYALTKLASTCVPIYIFLSGYGLAATNKATNYHPSNGRRVLRLMLNFWVVFIIFVPLGCMMRPDIFPGNIIELSLNAIAVSYSYNGAWWFLSPYVLLALSSTRIIRVLTTKNTRYTIFILCVFFIIYIGSYLSKSYLNPPPDSFTGFLLTIINTCYFLFVFSLGIIAFRYDIFRKLRSYQSCKNLFIRNNWILLGLLLCVCWLRISIGNSALLHIPFVCLIIPILVLLPKPKWILDTLLFLGYHSTNIWLCHYFFISYLLNLQVYELRYPILIWITVMTASLLTSCCINYILKNINKILFTPKLKN